MRERHPRDVVLVGFTTHTGTVTAAPAWGAPAERMRVRPAHGRQLRGHLPRGRDSRIPAVPARGRPLRVRRCTSRSLERAIGVIYRPQTERQSHWFASDITGQFDAVVHIDVTRAVEPLERGPDWDLDEPPETYPSAL